MGRPMDLPTVASSEPMAQVDPQTVGSHKLVLWTPPADDPERRKARADSASRARESVLKACLARFQRDGRQLGYTFAGV